LTFPLTGYAGALLVKTKPLDDFVKQPVTQGGVISMLKFEQENNPLSWRNREK
jgi:hypothetical protein